MEKLDFLRYYYINSAYRLLYNKLTKKRYISTKFAGRKLLTKQEGNDVIREAILKGEPFMAGRYGSGELRGVMDSIKIKLGLADSIRENTKFLLCHNAGFFPSEDEHVKKYGDLMVECAAQTDVLGVWFMVMEDYAINKFTNQAMLSHPLCFEPYYHEKPWTSALKGKKVLVIHPYEKSIINQYKKRELLFSETDILPEFELKTIKAVQTIAGEKSEFKDWFEALNSMVEKARNIDFDVAIIGCGAYGFPLAAKIKQMGKIAIHVGGATQILFGIKGLRWDNEHYKVVQSYFNEHWTRPLDEEIPNKAKTIEGGCYW